VVWGACAIHRSNHEERKFDREERKFDREERKFDREERKFDREERKFDETQHHNRIYPIMKSNRIVKNWEYFLHPV